MTARDDVRKLHAARCVKYFVGQDERRGTRVMMGTDTRDLPVTGCRREPMRRVLE